MRCQASPWSADPRRRAAPDPGSTVVAGGLASARFEGDLAADVRCARDGGAGDQQLPRDDHRGVEGSALRGGAVRRGAAMDDGARGHADAPVVIGDLVIVGSTSDDVYALDSRGRLRWPWSGWADIVGITADADNVYVASLDNIVRALKLENGNRQWRKVVATRLVFPPQLAASTLLISGIEPALTALSVRGDQVGTYALPEPAYLAAAPLVLEAPDPESVTLVLLARDGEVFGLRRARPKEEASNSITYEIADGRGAAVCRIATTLLPPDFVAQRTFSYPRREFEYLSDRRQNANRERSASHGALDSVDRTSKLDKHAVAHHLDQRPRFAMSGPRTSRRRAFRAASVPASSNSIRRL